MALVKSLQELHLSFNSNLTDAGIQELGVLEQLKQLYLFNCKKVTKGGIASLKKVLPDLAVYE